VRIASLLAVTLACGPAPGPVPPPSAPQLQLVRCVAAQPLPRTAVDTPDAIDVDAFARLSEPVGARRDAAPPRIANVTARPPTLSGALDASFVNRVVKARFPQLRACYEKELAATPGMAGSVTLALAVGADGKVAVARVIAVGVTATVSACVVRVMQALPFPAGKPGTAVYPLYFTTTSATIDSAQAERPGPRPVMPWTPFALEDDPPARSASGVARATAGAVRLGLATVASCFPATAPLGSLRAMFAVHGDGSITGVRAGGLGDAEIEACVARRLPELRVATPAHDTVEVACDLARGEARPWRVTPTAGYAVIEATSRAVRHGEATVTPRALDPAPLPADQTFLVIASPDATGVMLELAFAWAEQGDATVVAVRDGGGAPVFLGMAPTEHQVGGVEMAAVWPALRVGGGTLTACVERTIGRAPLGDPEAVDAVVRRIAARCRAVRCGGSLGVAIDPDATARELAQITGATRRAGFDRVLFGSYPGCAAGKPVRTPE
jgi:hypothetical protein